MFSGLGYNILKTRLLKKRQPIFLSLFITNHCNLRCKYCFVVDKKNSKEVLSAEYSKQEIFEIIDECYAMGTRMIFLLGGEPLVHPDIGEIVDYIVRKNIYLTICTNGMLIGKKLQDIRKTHVLAVSLDGIGDANDELRGKGVYAKAVEGIKVATRAGIKCRIHAVLTRRNMYSIRDFAQLTKDLNISLTISPPNFLGTTDIADMQISREEYKAFWSDYLGICNEGFPIANNRDAIHKCMDWPTDYHQFIRVGEQFNGYKPTFCMNGHTYMAIGGEGTMYNCINLGCLNGPNIKKIGIKKAWDTLLEWRPDCTSCASINCIETAMMLQFHLRSLAVGWHFHH